MKQTREINVYDPRDPDGERVLMVVTVTVDIADTSTVRLDTIEFGYQHKRHEDWERGTQLDWWS